MHFFLVKERTSLDQNLQDTFDSVHTDASNQNIENSLKLFTNKGMSSS